MGFFKNIINLMAPAAHLPPLTSQSEIDQSYKYWRTRTVYSIFLGYTVFYFTRKSVTFATPVLMDELGFTSSDIGFLSSLLYISYGFSKFFSGVLCDRSNPRYFFAFGLILTGILNIFFGFFSSLWGMAICWALNGWFQGYGWPACAKQLTYWFSQSERGFWWSLTSTSHNVGGAIIPLLAAYCASHFGWRWAMWVPGGIAIFIGLILIERLRDIPQSLGLPPIETYKQEEAESCQPSADKTLSVREILLDCVLNNKAVWALALSYFFVYVVRMGVNDWISLYLVKDKGYTMLEAAKVVTWFEAGGFLGTIAAGWGSDYFFQGRRVPYMALCSAALIFCFMGLWVGHSSYSSAILDVTLITTIGFLIFGPQVLVGLAAVEFVDKQAACTAHGLAGVFAYVGAAVTGYPLGLIIEHWGWDGFFLTNIICSLITVIILVPLWTKKRGLTCAIPTP